MSRTVTPMAPLEIALADTIRAERSAAHLTQHEVAQRAGMHPTVYIRCETGARHIDVDQLTRLAAALPEVRTPLELIRLAEARLAARVVSDPGEPTTRD